MASNLPSNIGRHTAFKDKPYTHLFSFPDDYNMPSSIIGQVRRNGRVIESLSPEIAIEGKTFSFTYSVEKLQKMQGLSLQFFLFDGIHVLGGYINVLIDTGEHVSGSSNIIIAGGDTSVVEIGSVVEITEFQKLITGVTKRVPTYQAMIGLLIANTPQKFTIVDDEFQGVESVPYEWDGVELFVYGTLVDPQPIL